MEPVIPFVLLTVIFVIGFYAMFARRWRFGATMFLIDFIAIAAIITFSDAHMCYRY